MNRQKKEKNRRTVRRREKMNKQLVREKLITTNTHTHTLKKKDRDEIERRKTLTSTHTRIKI